MEEEIDGEANRVDWPDSTVPQPTPSTPTGDTDGAVTVAGTSTGTGGRGGAARGSAKRRKSSASSSHQRRSLILPPSDDEERRSLFEGEEGGEDDDGSGEYVDEEEIEYAFVDGTPSALATTTGDQRTALPIPWGRKHIGYQPDEEDDELMMYAKVELVFLYSCAVSLTRLDLQDNPHRVRPPHENHQRDRPRLPRRKSITDHTAQQRLSATTNNTSAPKRRTTETGPGGSSVRTKRRR